MTSQWRTLENVETATEDPATMLRAHRPGCGCGRIALRFRTFRSGRRLKSELKSRFVVSFGPADGTTATRCFPTALPQLCGREMGRPWEGEERCKKVRLDEPGIDPLLRLRSSLAFFQNPSRSPFPLQKRTLKRTVLASERPGRN